MPFSSAFAPVDDQRQAWFIGSFRGASEKVNFRELLMIVIVQFGTEPLFVQQTRILAVIPHTTHRK